MTTQHVHALLLLACALSVAAQAVALDPPSNPPASAPDASSTSSSDARAPNETDSAFQLHVGIRGGASALWASSSSVIDTDTHLGYGFGLHIAPLWSVAPTVSLGPILSVATLTHESDTLATTIHTPAIGALLRWHLLPTWVLNADLDYIFGKASTTRAGGGFGGASAQLPPVGGSSDIHGLQLGAELLYHWSIVDDDVALEIGVNLSYQMVFAVDLPDSPDLQSLAAALTIKAWRGF
jgi:hypothetical protein